MAVEVLKIIDDELERLDENRRHAMAQLEVSERQVLITEARIETLKHIRSLLADDI